VNLGDDLSMTNNQYFSTSLKPTIHFMSWCAILPFIAFTLLIWFPVTSLELDVLNILRLYSAVIISFIAGSVWSAALLIQIGKETLVFNRKNLMLGASFVAVLSWLVLFIDAKAGVVFYAFLFLVFWQIELKTNLARIYPQWFWTLRTKQTMAIALCLMGVWMTLG
jgi:hypothetical protein